MINLTDPKTIRGLLKLYGLTPKKELGQNFLINPQILADIINTSHLTNHDLVVEVGPGLGTLTLELAKLAGKVVTIEKDRQLMPILQSILQPFANVEIVNQDLLKLGEPFYRQMVSKQYPAYKVIANLPYCITSGAIKHFLSNPIKPSMMVIMVQKEVAERIVAEPPDESILSISVKFYGKPEIVRLVDHKDFWPSPEVDSAILKIVTHSHFNWHNIDEPLFFKIVKSGFSEKRKQIKNSLSHALNLPSEQVGEWLSSCQIAPQRRAETLSLEEWLNLYRHYEKLVEKT